MRKLFSTLALCLTALSVLAVPAKKGLWRILTLTDGKEVSAQLIGDENIHYWQTADGRQLSEQPDGTYADADMQQLRATARERLESLSRLRAASTRRTAIGDFMKYTGQKRGLIILVEFSNMKFQENNNQELYNRICNEPGFNEGNFVGSVYDYFYDQSYGQFELNFDVVGPVTMSENYQYYGKDSGGQGNDMHPGEMVATACQAVADLVDFADYDWDGDGRVDQVMCIYAGQGQADGGESSTIWPHEWALQESDFGQELELDGVIINTYAVANERRGNSIEGIGTICHEFSHCLGLPDMYDIAYGGNYGMDEWSLMDAGSYNGNGFCPAGYSSFDRLTCGWVEPVELVEDQTVSALYPLCDSADVYVIRNKGFYDEYYLLENRQKKGWDRYVPSTGLLVLHVDFDRDVWMWNLVNTSMTASDDPDGYPIGNDHPRCTPFRPGGNSRYGSHDTYPYGDLDSLSNTSKPAATVYNPNSDGSRFMNCSISKIKESSKKRISFDFRNTPTEPVRPQGAVFYESFDGCVGFGGNDGQWGSLIASSVMFTDNEGWNSSNAFGGYKCARFGTSLSSGVATTPDITVSGPSTLTFRAAAWQGDDTKLTLSISGEATIEPESVEMSYGQWTDYTVNIGGEGPVNITFQAAKRFLLDEVCVAQGTTQGISTAVAGDVRTADGIFTLSGQRVTKPSAGLYIINGRKVIVR